MTRRLWGNDFCRCICTGFYAHLINEEIIFYLVLQPSLYSFLPDPIVMCLLSLCILADCYLIDFDLIHLWITVTNTTRAKRYTIKPVKV